MAIVSMNDLIMFAKHARLRYVQVVYKDMVGYIWLPTNSASHEVFMAVDETDESASFEPVTRGPFVKPTRPARR